MFTDDTTFYCISDTAEKVIAQLNKALHELYEWCLINRLTNEVQIQVQMRLC